MIGVSKAIGADALPARSMEGCIAMAFLSFKAIPSLLSRYSSSPTLHYSIKAYISGHTIGPYSEGP